MYDPVGEKQQITCSILPFSKMAAWKATDANPDAIPWLTETHMCHQPSNRKKCQPGSRYAASMSTRQSNQAAARLREEEGSAILVEKGVPRPDVSVRLEDEHGSELEFMGP